MDEPEKREKLEEFEKQIDQEMERYPAWDPQPGEKLVGEVIAHRFAGGYDLIVVRPLEGEPRTVRKSAVLKRLFEQIKLGNLVAIKCLGTQASVSTRRQYKNYRFEIRRHAIRFELLP